MPRDAANFAIIETDASARICGFQEKPIPGDPHRAFASRGNDLFKAVVLRSALEEVNVRGEAEFGHHVLPFLSKTH